MPSISRANSDRVLLIGDASREVEVALAQALPSAHITSVANYFDGIAELSLSPFSAVIASAEPIERRPDAAVRTLRDLAGNGRLILFAHPTLEPLSRKMLDFGCDDYIVTPPNAAELQQILSPAPMRLAADLDSPVASNNPMQDIPRLDPSAPLASLNALPVAELLLDALVHEPQNAPLAAVERLNALLPSPMRLTYIPQGKPVPTSPDGTTLLTHIVRAHNSEAGQLHLHLPPGADENDARHVLAHIARQFGKIILLQDRHQGLVRQATVDELTGAYNRRWFKHFLLSIINSAKTRRFGITLLLFDIDDFKKYNDRFGHQLGDEILRETARLMRRCTREHDLVARIGGDEFAVVFWEKEGPRQPKEPGKPSASRHQQTPRLIFERFQRLIATSDFPALGATGQGRLSISGGFASFPWDGRTMDELIEAADRDLMFGAKQRKNTIMLVGNRESEPELPKD